LNGEKNKLRHAEKIHQALDRAQNLLIDSENSAMERLDRARREVDCRVRLSTGIAFKDVRFGLRAEPGVVYLLATV
ncbi:MAG: hypothetical protein ACE1ZV_03540, partial [Alphaproteobacteria bacterium]